MTAPNSFWCKCTHNRSQHRDEPHPFRSERNTSCRHVEPGKEPCYCGEFRPVDETEMSWYRGKEDGDGQTTR